MQGNWSRNTPKDIRLQVAEIQINLDTGPGVDMPLYDGLSLEYDLSSDGGD